VNGGLFSGSIQVPKFSKIARSYLLHIGNLDWTQINPDIFGSMIQAVADDEERGSLGMHYTSAPNILKLLNPLFLDDLRELLEEAGDNGRKLLNLRQRISRIRVFDPACGSGNFLVIAYKQMREVENKINELRGNPGRKSDIPLTNFLGIELRDFSAEIARLALIIAEYQCNVLYRGQNEALQDLLPLDADNWITCDNALQLDWASVCPPYGGSAKYDDSDLFDKPLEQAQIDFDGEKIETYICGNPPYLGSTWQSEGQKQDLGKVFSGRTNSWKSLDYVAGWLLKAAEFGRLTPTKTAFVTTNSICQGQQVPILWPLIHGTGHEIIFAHTSFKWSNLASKNAGVTVAIIGISDSAGSLKKLYSHDNGEAIYKDVANINGYLVAAPNIVVKPSRVPLSSRAKMTYGNKPVDGGYLFVEPHEFVKVGARHIDSYVRPVAGSHDSINGTRRFCLWIRDEDLSDAQLDPFIAERISKTAQNRLGSKDRGAQKLVDRAHQFRDTAEARKWSFIVPRHSSISRPYLPVSLLPPNYIINDSAFAIYDGDFWSFSLLVSRLHLVWVSTVCGKIKTDYRYSNTLGWNTFPIPKLTQKNREDLVRCAEDILLARERQFPATIADLYDEERMPGALREAHERNDEVLERIYIGRRFKNDTERLERLFELYNKITSLKPVARQN
jgi:hypothetical protein